MAQKAAYRRYLGYIKRARYSSATTTRKDVSANQRAVYSYRATIPPDERRSTAQNIDQLEGEKLGTEGRFL